MLWDAKYFEPQCCHDHYSPLYGVVHDITRHCVYLMVAMSESVSRHCNNGRCYVHRNCKCFEAIVVTSLSLTQYTCTYMHNIIRPNTQPGIVTPTQERCGLEAQEAQLEKMVGALLSPVWGNGQRQMIFWSLSCQGNGQHLLGHLVGQRQMIS